MGKREKGSFACLRVWLLRAPFLYGAFSYWFFGGCHGECLSAQRQPVDWLAISAAAVAKALCIRVGEGGAVFLDGIGCW